MQVAQEQLVHATMQLPPQSSLPIKFGVESKNFSHLLLIIVLGMTQNEAEIQEEIFKFYENLYKGNKAEEPDQQAMDQILQLLRNKKVASWKVCEGKP